MPKIQQPALPLIFIITSAWECAWVHAANPCSYTSCMVGRGRGRNLGNEVYGIPLSSHMISNFIREARGEVQDESKRSSKGR